MKIRRAAALALVALSLAGCTIRVDGAPDAEVVRPSILPAVDELPKPGQCANEDFAVVDCGTAHELEVIEIGAVDGFGADYPDDPDLRRAALRPCRAALTGYLGSADHDATRLQAHALWPSRDGWARGDRWRVCAVVELMPDGTRVQRTSSAKDHLRKAGGFSTVQLCAAASPGNDRDPLITTCDQPHRAEAVPGALKLGEPQDPSPSKEAFEAKATEHCAKAVRNYVGADRSDVSVSMRLHGSQAWSEGWTSAICYAEANRPFTGRLWGLGQNPLPN